MSDVGELLEAFEAGTLLRPAADVPNLVDLARAFATVAGAEGLELTAAARELAGVLGAREHLVLVLADGLGLEMLEREPAAPFLRAHLAQELRGVFPASTAVALTSLATGEWPAQHAVTGWWTHLEEIGGPATILQYRRRSDDRPLLDLGVEPGRAFPVPSLLPRLRRRTLCLLPQAIAGSVYSHYWTGGEPATGYSSLAEAFASVGEAVRGGDGPSFSYVYAPHVDHAAHQGGPDSREARSAVVALDRLMERLAGELGDAARVVLTSESRAPDRAHAGAAADSARRWAAGPAGEPAVGRLARDRVPRSIGRGGALRGALPGALRRVVLPALNGRVGGAGAVGAAAAGGLHARTPRRLHGDRAGRGGAGLPAGQGLARGAAAHLAPRGPDAGGVARAAGRGLSAGARAGARTPPRTGSSRRAP